MSVTVPGAAAASRAPQQFLQQVQARAWCYAGLCTASDTDPVDSVERAMRRFWRHGAQRSPADWGVLFWAGMVAQSGQAAPGSARAEPGDALARALARLPLGQRQAFLLRVWLDFDVEQIARMLHVPVPDLQAELVRAVQVIRPALAGGTPEQDLNWARDCRRQLDRRAARLPAPVRQRLDAARSAVLRRRWPRRWRPGRRPLGIGLVLAGLLLLVSVPLDRSGLRLPVLSTVPLSRPVSVPAEPIEQLLSLPAEDFQLLASNNEFELLADLEFYRWLQETSADDE